MKSDLPWIQRQATPLVSIDAMDRYVTIIDLSLLIVPTTLLSRSTPSDKQYSISLSPQCDFETLMNCNQTYVIGQLTGMWLSGLGLG